jgi:ribosomal protein L11
MFTPIKNAWTRFRSRQILLELLVSACLASLVWLYTHNRTRNSIDQVPVPVQVQLAAHQRDLFILEMPDTSSVLVSFTGSQARIREVRRKLQRGLLRANLTVTIPDAKKSEAMFSQTLQVDEDAIAAPAGVKVEIAQGSVEVTVQRLSERTLPVKLEWTGDAHLSHIKIEPASVLVRGPKAVLDHASYLPTKPYAVQVNPEAQSAATAEVRDQIPLVTELDGRPIVANPGNVQVRFNAAPRLRVHELADIPIHFLCPKESPWRPRFGSEKDAKVTLKLIGPATEQTPPVSAFVDLTSGNLARGRNLSPLRLQLPKDFQLVEPATPLATFYLDEFEQP